MHLPIGRFVDDLFAPERAASVEHAMNCVARQAVSGVGQVLHCVPCMLRQVDEMSTWAGSYK